jgi:amidophosphoribosyltransferase
LGRLLLPQVLKAVNFDLKNTVFSYVPNTAETCFLGMMEEIEDFLVKKRKEIIIEGKPNLDSLEDILSFKPRIEKLVSKDVKLRTFITEDNRRDDLVAHVYDTTYEVIQKYRDNIVIVDDSIVRGTTLEKSILTMLGKLEPKKVVIVSSAPQIRYPDCYGIDMSKMKEFVAFRAVLKLIQERDMSYLLDDVYHKCIMSIGQKNVPNYVKEVYAPFTEEEISNKIAEIVTPKNFKPEVKVVYQSVDNLHKAIPKHTGDWYFTGDYPTMGGNRIVNRAFVIFMEGKLVRAY